MIFQRERWKIVACRQAGFTHGKENAMRKLIFTTIALLIAGVAFAGPSTASTDNPTYHGGDTPRVIKTDFYAKQVKHTCTGTGLVEVRGMHVNWSINWPSTRKTESGLKQHRYWVVKANSVKSAYGSSPRIYGKVTATAKADAGYALPAGEKTVYTFDYKKPKC